MVAEGRAAHQGPEDGSTRLVLPAGPDRTAPDRPAPVGEPASVGEVRVGDLVRARVTDGVDLVAVPVAVLTGRP